MLEFNTRTAPVVTTIPDLDLDGLEDRLLASGHKNLDVNWEGAGPVAIPVWGDGEFLCQAYIELPSFATEGREHDVFLGDGALELEARRDEDVVTVVWTHTPFLHRDFSKTGKYTTSLGGYVGAWIQLMRELVELAKAAPGG